MNLRIPVIAFLLFVAGLAIGSIAYARLTGTSDGLNQLRFVPGDEKGNNIKALKAAILVTQSNNMAMKTLQKLIVKYRGTPLEPGLLFRKAELYMRESNTARFFSLRRDKNKIITLIPAVAQLRSVRNVIGHAVNIYDKIQRQFPNYDRIDLVTFNDGFARQQLNQTDEAMRLYQKIVDQYPNSILIPDSQLAMGEIQYQKEDFKGAIAHYLKIQDYPNSRAYPYGLYKAAWAYYNLRHNKKAIGLLEQVVAYGNRAKQNGFVSKLDLKGEALRDMTLFFEDTYPSSYAVKYFTKEAGAKHIGPIILRLARLYHSHSRYKDVIASLNDFISDQPDSKYVHVADYELIKTYEDMRDRESALKQMEKMNELCDDTRPDTPEKPLKNDLMTSRNNMSCDQLLLDTSNKLSNKWHAMWLKNPKFPIFAKVAKKAYEIELGLPKQLCPDRDRVRFNYAQLLFQMHLFRKASQQYARVSEITKDSKLRNEANHSALVALGNAIGNKKWSDSDEARFGQLANNYIKADPHGKYVLDIRFKVAFIAYQKNDYKTAEPVFQDIGWKYPNTVKGRHAQDLYLDILNIKKDYATLRMRSKQLLAMRGLSTKRQAQITKIYRQSYFAEVQQMVVQKHFNQAIVQYKKFASNNPDSPLAEKALWNAIQLQYQTNNYHGAIASSVEFYKKYPQSKNARVAMVQAAQGFEAMAQLAKAAKVLQDLARTDTAHADKWLFVAAHFYALNGEPYKARPIFRELAHSPDRKTARLAAQQWQKLEEDTNHVAGLSEVDNLIMQHGFEPMVAKIELHHVQDLFAKGHDSSAFDQAKKIVGDHQASNRVRAQARMIQAEVLENEFLHQSVKARVDRIALVLDIKTEKLAKAQEAFQAVIRYGDPKSSIEAMEQLSNCYLQYANSLRSMRLPKGSLKSDQLTFQKEIDSLAIPMEEKGVDTVAQALTMAKKLKLYDHSVMILQQKLNQLNQVPSQPQEMALKVPPPFLPTIRPGADL